ncbi:MAG TPA: calcium-binding EGF-like domain-containing protein, partial [Polyangiales bacterium]|nr:calcium-binding EGF-like domain-containing protein [Polyangiales bacterium]
ACSNVVGTFSCVCPTGYAGTGQGVSGCADVNECTLNTDNCDSTPDACKNTVGAFSCACPVGYSGNGVGQFGCCLPVAGQTDITHPADGVDNECDGMWDRPSILTTVYPEAGGAAAIADVSIPINTSVIPGATVQCRSYRRGAAAPVFATCTNPARNTATPSDGAWRTEVRWSWADGRVSHPVAYDYYVHSSLNGASKCSLGVADDSIFTTADSYLKASNLPVLNPPVVDPGPFLAADTFLTNPFVTVTYQPLRPYSFTLRRTVGVSGAANSAFSADMWSLRKRFVMSANGRYVLIRRTYSSKAAWNDGIRDCKVARFEYADSDFIKSKAPAVVRWLYVNKMHECDAVVVNRAGAGVCVTVNAGSFTIATSHRFNKYSKGWGYRVSTTVAPDNFMWRHLLDERGWHSKLRGVFPAPESGFRNFSQKCAATGCNSDDTSELFLPDKALLRP